MMLSGRAASQSIAWGNIPNAVMASRTAARCFARSLKVLDSIMSWCAGLGMAIRIDCTQTRPGLGIYALDFLTRFRPPRASLDRYRSFGVSPVFFARTFIAVGPRVTLSWYANNTSGQPGRSRMRCEVPLCRLMRQPIRSSAARACFVLVEAN